MHYDALVIGGGFAGLNALYRLRQRGMHVLLVEAGSGVGGTWHWNRYPGARVDIESYEYCYDFCDDLQQEWRWSEKYSTQPDVLRYLEWVTDRLALRADMRFNRRVLSLTFDQDAPAWSAVLAPTTDLGTVVDGGPLEHLDVRHVVLATGFLSTAQLPAIPGLAEFEGRLVHTAAWPKDGADLADRSVGVIGTASSGVQVVQETCQVARHLTVFQRTANWCLPLRNGTVSPQYDAFVKANYPEIRRLEKDYPGPGMVLMDGEISLPESRRMLDIPAEEREASFERRWRVGGLHLALTGADLVVDPAANQVLRAFLESKIRETVRDRVTAELLIPTHPPLTRRPPGESGYYEAFNRDNVALVDVRSDPIATVTRTGVTLHSGRSIPLDVLICATGFDAGTGAALRITIRGLGGLTLQDAWADGAQTHLGMMVAGFPNLYLLNGPQSPSPFFSPPVLADYQSRHVLAVIDRFGGPGAVVEPSQEAQDCWVRHVDATVAGTLMATTDSWWLGTNVPGKPRRPVGYIAGFKAYRKHCAAALASAEAYRAVAKA